jgi:putative Holliday junction resolvase
VKRILGVDLGERRIGIALADGDGGRAMPLVTLKRASSADRDADALAQLARDYDVGEIVVGLPLDASGAEGQQARLTRSWITTVETQIPLPVTLRDERLTSHVAEERAGPMKRGRSGGPPTASQRQAWRARIDREAAAIILQDELDAREARRQERVSPDGDAHDTETNG